MGRLEKEIVLNTGAYTRYEYPTNGIQSKVFSTITDVNSNNTADVADEVLSESWTDGAGRVRRSRSEHPGSAGGWSATLTEYDVMGRTWRSTVPTEVNSGWSPAGDDASRGWIWNTREFDWKGRVTRQINTDGTDKLFSYTGCGCAGGQITTIQGELVPRDDQPTVMARRTQKVYEDILGRTFKSETLNWDGSVYSTSKSFFNGRDQVTLQRQFAGADSSSTFQDTAMTYDGYGRLKTQKRPEQNTGTATTYNYFPDDRIQQTIDARGATINYQYNNRGLVIQVSTTSPNPSLVPVTPTVTYAYDNLGNRTNMTDGLGSLTYEYNQLSQLAAETRSFTDSLPNAPLSNNSFSLEYSYSLSGQLKSYKDPFGQQFNYAQDKIGRLSAVTGSASFGGITTYANNPGYRAWGALKTLSYGDGMQMSLTFNNRLQAGNYNLTTNNSSFMGRNYEYYNDGSLKYVQNLNNNKFDRLQTYDHAGRIKEAKSGAEARGQTAASPLNENLPYRQSYQHNAFEHLVMRNNLHWGRDTWDESFNLTYFYSNNRESSWSYDADGNALSKGYPDGNYESSVYDSAGQMTKMISDSISIYPHTFPLPEESVTQLSKSETYRYYDGNGRELKRISRSCIKNANLMAPCTFTDEPPRYFVRSSVFGSETISEVNSIGKKLKTYIKANGTTLAWQALTHKHPGGFQDYNPPLEAVYFERSDASGMSRRINNVYGPSVPASEIDPVETDPQGGNVGTENPYDENATPAGGNGECKSCDFNGNFELKESSLTTINGEQKRCMQDGLTVPCEQIRRELDSARLGGALGALERGAAASAAKLVAVGINLRDGNMNNVHIGGAEDESRFADIARRSGTTLHRFLFVSDNWSLRSAMTPSEQKPPSGQQDEKLWAGLPVRRVTTEEASKLKAAVEKAASNTETCKKYISDLLNQVAKDTGSGIVSTNVSEIFENVLNIRRYDGVTDGSMDGGIWLFKKPSIASYTVNSREWVGGTGYAEIALSWEGGDDLYTERGGMRLIHELLHAATMSTFAGIDQRFAEAAATLAGEDLPFFSNDLDKKDPRYREFPQEGYSAYFDRRLNYACGYKSTYDAKFTVYKLYK